MLLYIIMELQLSNFDVYAPSPHLKGGGVDF